VPNLEHYQIVIALAPEAKGVSRRRTVCLDWSIVEPSTSQGSPEEVKKAYEDATSS
jgi:hypothetical protein